jgi:hypothetical protein
MGVGMPSGALAKPLGAAATLRIIGIEDFVPAGEPRVVGVGETLGDDALTIGVVAPLLPRRRAG